MERVEYKLDKGIFSFLAMRSHHLQTMYRILTQYAGTLEMSRPKKNRLRWYTQVSELAQMNFSEFKKFYNKNKQDFPVFDPNSSYEDEWQESNLDGSFAYNGVTEDF